MNLFFQDIGTGRPLIILHGLFGLSDNWISLARALSDNFRVIVPDLRNHGRSPHSPVFDFPALEEDLLRLMESLDLESARVMGHSLGGKTAMFFALHHPSRVGRLVVVDISLRKYGHNAEHENLVRAMQEVNPADFPGRTELEKALASRVPDERLRQFLMKNVHRAGHGSLAWRLNVKGIGDNLPALFEGVDIPGIYEGPALFIRGGKSDYVRDDDIPAIQKKFPGAVIRTLPGATHWVHADAPGEFREIVEEFLLPD
jgi:pimeloyl-ACP methyl ester carboxylesterase